MKKTLFLFCLLPLLSSAQIITTVAGNHIQAFSGDGGPAINAELNTPSSICMDGAGNLMISDALNHNIRKVDPSGIITTIAGNGTSGYSGDGGPATDAAMTLPFGIVSVADGYLFVADEAKNVIRKINSSGVITTYAGTGVAGYNGDNIPATNAELYGPYGLAFDISGNLYITDVYNFRIRKVDAAGIITTVAGTGHMGFGGNGGPATAARFGPVSGIAVSRTGTVYFTDYENHMVRMISPAGIVTTIAGNGTDTTSGDGGPATDAGVKGANGLYLDQQGNLFISDNWAHIVRMVDTSGIITTIAGNGTQGFSGDGGPATMAQLFNPIGITMNNTGNLLIADDYNSVVRELTHHSEGVSAATVNHSVSIYPDPATNKISIASGTKIVSIAVYNQIGQIIFSNEFNADHVELNIADLPSGLYFIRINGCEVRKFLKE